MTSRLRAAAPAVVFAALLVGSVVAPFAVVGTASAQTVSQTVDASNAEYVAMDLSGLEAGEYQVEITVDPAPGGGSQTVYRANHTKAELPDVPAYRNSKAYDNVTVTITGTNLPTNLSIGTGDEFDRADWRNKDVFTSSGGDRDFNCDLIDRSAQAVNPAIEITDCNPLPGTTEVGDTSNLDAEDTKLEIWQAGDNEAVTARNQHTMLQNRLHNTETVAIVNHGQPAYIWSLNNGETQNSAEQNATREIDEYYSTIERNYLATWNGQVAQAEYLWTRAGNETGVEQWYVDAYTTTNDENVSDEIDANITGFGTENFTLQNGTTLTARTITITLSDATGSVTTTTDYTIGPRTGEVENATYDGQNTWNNAKTLKGVRIHPPTSSYEQAEPLLFGPYGTNFGEMDTQAQATRSEMGTVVNGTYSEYQEGAINASDLTTPATLHSNYSPASDEYQGYAAALFANLGISTPDNFSNIGKMEVEFEDGTTSEGVLMARNNPPSGQWETNVTYDPANISGSEFLVEDGNVREINQSFTLTNITTSDGESRQKIVIENRTYETTSAQELDDIYEEIAALRAEIDARQAALAGGSGLLAGGGSTVAIAVGVAILGYGVLSRDD